MTTNGFEFFEGTTSESTTVPRITVRKGGLLVLTQAAVEKMGEGVTHVRIGFNKATKAVGICPASAGESGSYRLRQQRNSVSRLIDGKRFFAHHGMSFQEPRRFSVEEFGNGMIGFSFNPGASEEEAPPKKTRKASS